MKLSVIIPAYNEAGTIGEVLRRIFAVNLDGTPEVIVVDDGSTDNTERAVISTGLSVVYIRQERNSGKGSAVRIGLGRAKGDVVIIQDADGEYDPEDYPRLIEPIVSGKAEVVYGSRVLQKSNAYSFRRYYWGGRLLSWWTNLLYGSNITDEPTGYKVFRTDVVKSLRLNSKGFEFCPEVTAKILKRGIKITEVPISYKPRSFKEGKKIRWEDGVKALWTLFILRYKK